MQDNKKFKIQAMFAGTRMQILTVVDILEAYMGLHSEKPDEFDEAAYEMIQGLMDSTFEDLKDSLIAITEGE